VLASLFIYFYMNSIIYTRISSANQSSFNNRYTSIQTQQIECENYCNRQNFVVNQVYSEVKSGRNIKNQRELMEIFNTFNNINLVVYNVDRFTRDCINGIKYIYIAKKKNITIHFVENELKNTNIHDLHKIRTKLSHAVYESDILSNRIRRNNKTLLRNGWKFGIPKFGFKTRFINGIRKTVKSSTEQNIINFIITARTAMKCSKLNMILKKILPQEKNAIVFLDNDYKIIRSFDRPNTLSFGEIAELLNEYNITNRYHKQWTAGSVNRIFKNNY
jgi:DNA invertase Pin-like site-specific DNA recombinase